MAKWNTGPKNGMWAGGKVTASNGYVLLRVGVDHPLADIRGYAYEHRVVAMTMLGRALRRGEIVHHKDGNKTNNAPGNLEVMPSGHHHRHAHSKRRDTRSPGEKNPRIACACGCGTKFRRYDTSGRPRRYVAGHNVVTKRNHRS